MACDLNTLLENSCESGIGKLTNETKLLQIIAQLLCDAGGSSGEYSEYVASVSQLGGAVAPTSTVLKNTLIGTPVWSYLGIGEYRLTLVGGFPVGSTVVIFGPPSAADGLIILQGQNNDAIEILIGAGEDGRMDKVALVIRVYP